MFVCDFFQGQVLCISRLEEAVRDAEFIFEAVVEDLQVKQNLIRGKAFLLILPASLKLSENQM